MLLLFVLFVSFLFSNRSFVKGAVPTAATRPPFIYSPLPAECDLRPGLTNVGCIALADKWEKGTCQQFNFDQVDKPVQWLGQGCAGFGDGGCKIYYYCPTIHCESNCKKLAFCVWQNSICTTPTSTLKPTVLGPTTSPVISTGFPTVSPSFNPTNLPTTSSPTSESPTLFPTLEPTTSNPTLLPTVLPSKAPISLTTTSTPTRPTNRPQSTNPPTLSPTNRPKIIVQPTLSPTVRPISFKPTSFSPTKPTPTQTTSSPSKSPTQFRTQPPSTKTPSTAPTISSSPVIPITIPPTNLPTSSPGNVDTNQTLNSGPTTSSCDITCAVLASIFTVVFFLFSLFACVYFGWLFPTVGEEEEKDKRLEENMKEPMMLTSTGPTPIYIGSFKRNQDEIDRSFRRIQELQSQIDRISTDNSTLSENNKKLEEERSYLASLSLQ